MRWWACFILLLVVLPSAAQVGSWENVYQGHPVGTIALQADTVLAAGVQGQVLVSYDRGTTWTVQDVFDDDVVVDVAACGGSLSLANSAQGSLRWARGLSGDWQDLPSAAKGNLLDCDRSTIWIAGGIWVYVSRDFGRTWETVIESEDFGSNQWTMSDRELPGPRYIGKYGCWEDVCGALFSSADGESWVPVPTWESWMPVKYIEVVDATTVNVYAGKTSIFRTTDQFANVDLDFPVIDANATVVIDGSTYLANRNGVFVSTDEGKRWHEFGLTDHRIEELMVDDGGYLWAAGASGLWRSAASVTTSVDPATETSVDSHVYPNPFGDAVTVEFESHWGTAHLEVFDAMGRCRHSTVITSARSELDSSTWAPGLYYFRTTEGGQVVVVAALKL